MCNRRTLMSLSVNYKFRADSPKLGIGEERKGLGPARSKAWVWGRSLSEHAGSNPAEGMGVCLLCLVR
jgi:hypothetical protein